jgi:hypothetical protein
MGGGVYFGLLLLPFAGFPVVAGAFLLPGLGDVAANMLSAANPIQKSIFSYHSVSLVPVLATAAIYGVARVSRWQKRFSLVELTGVVLAASTITGVGYAPLPLPGAHNYWAPEPFTHPDPDLPAVRTAVGDGASVSAQANVGAHFSQRKEIHLYPNKVYDVDVIVLRLDSPTTKVDLQDPGRGAGLAWHLQMRPADYLGSIQCLLSGKEYSVALWRDPWLVLSRSGHRAAAENEVQGKIEQLRNEWQVPSDEYRASVAACPM